MSLLRIISVLLLLLMTAGLAPPLRNVRAASSASNVIANGSFENGVNQQGIPSSWSFDSCEGVANATARVDASLHEDGASSAEISTGALTPTGCYPGSQCSPTSCPGRSVGFSQFRQGLPGFGYNITQLSDDPAGFSFWFQLHPYNVSTGMAAFEVRVFGAESLAELDYVFNADPAVGQYQNSTSTHSLIFNGYQYGQWYHFSRNLRADWLTPMGTANTPLNLNYNFTLLQFQGFATESGSTIKSETVWLDDVRVYTGALGPSPLLQVWSPDTRSNTIASTGAPFQPGGTFTVLINVTNAGPISGFDVTLAYAISSSIDPPISTSLSQVSLSPGLFDGSTCNVFVAEHKAFSAPIYKVRVAAVFLGHCSSPGVLAGTGTLFSVQFNVTGTGTTSLDIVQTLQGTGQKQELVVGGSPDFKPVLGLQVSDMIFQNVAGALPVASFTYSPLTPFIGDEVSFDASQSYYPGDQSLADRGIKQLIWSFDDASQTVQGTMADVGQVHHTFLITPTTFASGYFSVRLVVMGQDSQLLMRMEQVVYISRALVDDVSVSLVLSQTTVLQGQPVFATAAIRNNGNRVETANLKVMIDNPQQQVVGTWNGTVPFSGQSLFTFTIDTGNLTIRTYTVTATVMMENSTGVIPDPTPLDDAQSAAFTILPPDVPPVATFTVRPASPIAGHQVQFDGSESYDPDGYIVNWQWSFGDGFSESFGSYAYHAYTSPGNYTVTLTVQDNRGLTSSSSMVLDVLPSPQHDVGIVYVQAYPQRAVSSQIVSISVTLVNNGNSTEMVDVTAYYGGHVAGSITGIRLFPSSYNYYYSIQWDTLGVSPGNYTISATVFLATDEHPADNTLSNGFVIILPPPTLTLTPSTGSQGTQVTVQGDGFPAYYGYVTQVLVTFDDQFVGFGPSVNGHFTFVFNIPLAQAGVHTVKALDSTGARAFGSFTITQSASSSRIGVSITGGTLYFPGDQAVVYVQTSLNGQPVSVSSLRIVLMRPSGPNVTLTAVLVSPGEWRVTYTVPSTGAIGTYAVVATAHQSGSLDGFGLSGFVVKPTWLQSHGTAVVGVTAAFSIVAGLAVAWRKGYFVRRKEDSPFL